MEKAQPTAREASILRGATMVVIMVGICIGIFLRFMDIDLAVRTAAAVLVGIVGTLSFVRHSVFF